MNLIETFHGLPAENRAENLKSFVDQVKNLKNCSNLVLAKVLYEIDRDEHYLQWQYEEEGITKTFTSINDFARVNFEYSSSTTQTFLRIHQKFCIELQVPDERITCLPWGNLRIVCPHVTAENVEQVLKLCEGKQKDVKEWAAQFQVVNDKPPKYSFTCSPEQAEIFDTALDAAREMIADMGGGPPLDSQVWEYIVSQFLMIEQKPMRLTDYLTLLESRFAVKLGLVEDAPIPTTPKESSVKSGAPFDEELAAPDALSELGLTLAEVPEEEDDDRAMTVEEFLG